MSGSLSIIGVINASISLVSGSIMVFAPRVYQQRVVREHEEKLRNRKQRGSDNYFEEQRSLEAYKPFKAVRSYRLLGSLLIILSVGYFALVLN